MAYNLKEESHKKDRLAGGHRMCAGCGAPVVVNAVLRGLKEEDHAVIGAATGCLEVSTFIYPYTAWTDSFIHTAFECAVCLNSITSSGPAKITSCSPTIVPPRTAEIPISYLSLFFLS